MKFRNFDKYEVYPDGRIWSYSRNKFLKPSTNKNGYQVVCLTDNSGKQNVYKLHRVVYESVTGEPIPENLQVNHINEDKTDNRFFENLNLMTPKENLNWGTRNERSSKTLKNNTNRSKAISKALTNNQKISKAVGAFKNGELVMTFQSTNEADRNGFKKCAVSSCCRNYFNRPGNNIYKGYEWRYI